MIDKLVLVHLLFSHQISTFFLRNVNTYIKNILLKVQLVDLSRVIFYIRSKITLSPLNFYQLNTFLTFCICARYYFEKKCTLTN